MSQKKERKCSSCGDPITRYSKTGRCKKCAQAQQAQDQTKAPADSLDVKGDTATVTRHTREVVRTLADLIRVCQIDTEEWEIERWVANKWEMGSVNRKTGDVQTEPLFQIKAWLKRNRPVLDAKARIAELVADAKKVLAPRPFPAASRPGSTQGLMLELSIPDLHLGKMAWSPETGYANYDIKIAEKLFDEAVEALVVRAGLRGYDRILLPIGNDLLNSDTKMGHTTAGTPQDNDGRFQKTFRRARHMLTRAIDRLRDLAPVDVVIVPGNHDQLSMFHLGDSLECLYHNTPGVTVENHPTLRKYVGFGRVALMFTHGDKGKAADWPLLFATERPEMFGNALYREIHTGHLHQTRLTEKMGVRVRISPALCPPDAWHAENQFVGNVRGAEAYVWHKTEGLISVAHFNVKEEEIAA